MKTAISLTVLIGTLVTIGCSETAKVRINDGSYAIEGRANTVAAINAASQARVNEMYAETQRDCVRAGTCYTGGYGTSSELYYRQTGMYASAAQQQPQQQPAVANGSQSQDPQAVSVEDACAREMAADAIRIGRANETGEAATLKGAPSCKKKEKK